MNPIVRRILVPAALLATLFVTGQAHAQATRTWVSGVGDDLNPCSRTAPCKTFAGAISKTLAGGEISALDPAGFGAITITKAITINGDGTLAGILAASTSGIIVNAGVADKVVIRNVSINGTGNGISGVRFLAGAQLTLDNVSISGFTTRGIDVARTATGSLFVTNSRITNCTTGIRLNTTAGVVGATIDNVHLDGLTTGIDGSTGTLLTLKNSTLNSNTTSVTASASGSTITIENSLLSLSGTAVNTVSGAVVRLSNNSIYSNNIGINLVAGATVQSDGTNRVAGNSNTAPILSALTVQ